MPMRAVQQIMLGTVTAKENQAVQTLSAIKKAGYDGIELNGFMIRPTSFMVRMMTKMAGMPVGKGGNLGWAGLVKAAGLSVVSVHEDLGTIQREPQTVIEEAKKFGTKYVVITGMYRFDYSDETAVRKLAEDLNEAGKGLKEGGVELLYHNHNCEFRKVSKEKTAYRMLMEETDPAYVNFEFDSYWPTEAGVDQRHGRIPAAYAEQPDLEKAPQQFKIDHVRYAPFFFLPDIKVSAAPVTPQTKIISMILMSKIWTAVKDTRSTATGRIRFCLMISLPMVITTSQITAATPASIPAIAILTKALSRKAV